MTPEQIKAVLLKFNEDFWHKQDIDASYQIVDDAIAFHRPPFPPTYGKAALREGDEGMLKAFSDIQSTIHEIIVEGDTAAGCWTWEATHTGISPSLGIPPAASA